MVNTGRQAILENNRSLRNIKSELETLLERGIISDDAFDKIHSLLPNESPLSGAPTPNPRQAHAPPTQPLAALSLKAAPDADAPPPSYDRATGNAAPPPLPTRKQTQPPAGKPVLCHARALYKYDASDARDCSLEKGDRVAVHERMNADWWMGKNLRTNQEGIFPKSYVEEEGGNEKAAAAGYGQQNGVQNGAGGQFPPPPGRANPYDSSVPPMNMANQGYGGGGGGQQKEEDSTGKKMGKKFGNAAMFGAGATFGGKIINSIF